FTVAEASVSLPALATLETVRATFWISPTPAKATVISLPLKPWTVATPTLEPALPLVIGWSKLRTTVMPLKRDRHSTPVPPESGSWMSNVPAVPWVMRETAAVSTGGVASAQWANSATRSSCATAIVPGRKVCRRVMSILPGWVPWLLIFIWCCRRRRTLLARAGDHSAIGRQTNVFLSYVKLFLLPEAKEKRKVQQSVQSLSRF